MGVGCFLDEGILFFWDKLICVVLGFILGFILLLCPRKLDLVA